MHRLKKYLHTNYQLSEKDWNLTKEYLQVELIQKGEYFVREGTICRALGFLAEGVMRYMRFEENGEETTCYFVSENDFVGDPDSFRAQKPSEMNLQAITNCTLITFTHDGYKKFLFNYPRFREIMTDIDHRTMMGLLNQRDFLLNKDAGEKYRQFIELFPHILQRVPLGYVASYLGIAQPSLSRLRRQLS